MQKIAALRDQAGWWGIAGTGLAFFADLGRFIFHLKDGAFFKAILDSLSLLSELTAFLQEIADKVGGSWQSALYNISSVIQQGIGVLNFARGILDMPFVGELVATYVGKFATWIMPALEGPAGIGMAIVETSLGEAAADFISAGAHWAQGQEFTLKNEANQDQAMSTDQFCRQDGGCPKS